MIVPSPISSIPLLLTIYQIRSLVDKNSFPKKRFLLVRRFLLAEQEEKKRRKFEMLPHLPRIPLDVDPKNFNSSIHEVQLDRGARLDSTFTLAARRIVLHTWGPWAWKGRDAASWIFSENFWAKRHEFTGTRVFVHEKVLVSIYLLSPSPPNRFPISFGQRVFILKLVFVDFVQQVFGHGYVIHVREDRGGAVKVWNANSSLAWFISRGTLTSLRPTEIPICLALCNSTLRTSRCCVLSVFILSRSLKI